ncbi:MAG: helix-turn-helix transcriptional regulator [Calothrix sp. SM1_7_51]|nr:helix-turn-helix transcriptional regulator [Calothrix sp. SM1_7_51]
MKRKAKPKIASLREKAGLTQLELSRRVGVTESTIQNWESGRTGTDHIERVIKFCQALNCTVEELIEYISEPSEELATQPTSLSQVQTLLGTQDQVEESAPNLQVEEAGKQGVGSRE